jgi:hypothetical protein
MENKQIQELIARYNMRQASSEDLKQIELLLEKGAIAMEDLKEADQLIDQVSRMNFPSPSLDLDDRFYQMLALERKVKGSFSWREFFSWPQLAPKLAFASVTLILGIAVGYYFKPATSTTDGEMTTVTQELKQLREMMMLSLLEKESATERLKAVSLTEEMDAASTKVTEALIQTLNEDENVNVRLAALEALVPYAQDSKVRQELIRSIARQESPLVQISLAELMAALQVKSSVKELQKIIQSEKTPDDVKKKIKQSIDVLI